MTGTIVAGIGATEFSKDSRRGTMQLAAEASRAAILDAGLTPAAVDGLVTFTVDGNDELELMRNLGIGEVNWWSRTPGGGVGACATVQHAVSAVVSGAANAVLVYRAFNERSGFRFGQPHRGPGTAAPLDWYFNFGIDTPAKMYALWFRRYMHAYGVTNEDFGRYTVSARRYAATNPKAWFYERPITLDDHQASRWIVEPVLRLYDCCQESDGGVALVVTRADRAVDTPQPVSIVAVADAHHRNASITHNYYHDDLATYPEAAACARACSSSDPGCAPPTSTSRRSTRTSARWCSSCSRRTASADRARLRRSSPRGTSTSTAPYPPTPTAACWVRPTSTA